jgi:DNA recombination protein RmuC
MDWPLILLFCLGLVIVVLLIYRQQSSPLNFSDPLRRQLQQQNDQLQQTLEVKELAIREMTAQIASRDQQVIHLQERLQMQKREWEENENRLKAEFENLANRLLVQKGEQLRTQSLLQMEQTLLPLKEKIREFGAQIDQKFLEETREKSALKKEIEHLHDLNTRLSRDANNLAEALKGQSKVQGDWGEIQLEVLLEKSGLQKGLHFEAQTSIRDHEGQLKRPDFIIQLPENRHLIIDAKVSLTAFERFFNDADPDKKERHLKDHIDSIRSHVDQLSKKAYQQLPDIHTPDYLLLFVPIETALVVATQRDPRLFTDALERNIVLVSTSSLLTTMRTVSHLWRQEKQNKSVQEIARQSGFLYDKFVAFVEDLRLIGLKLDQTQQAYGDAMNKLTSAVRPGDTLIGKAEKIRQLGAKTSKLLPSEFREEGTIENDNTDKEGELPK